MFEGLISLFCNVNYVLEEQLYVFNTVKNILYCYMQNCS